MSESITLTPFWSGLLLGALGLFAGSILVIWLLSTRYRRKVSTINREVERLLADKHQINSGLAIADQKIANLENHQAGLEREITEKVELLSELQNEVTRLKTTNAELSTRIEEERIRAGEKLELIKSAEQQMIHHFKSLGAKILEEKSKTFTEQNQLNLDRLLSPLRDQLGEFRKKVDDVYVADSNDRASLREAIRTLNLENQRIGQEANNLARALKGDKKTGAPGANWYWKKCLNDPVCAKESNTTARAAFETRIIDC